MEGSRRAVWSSAWPFCPPRGHTDTRPSLVSRGTVDPHSPTPAGLLRGKRAALAPTTPAWPGARGLAAGGAGRLKPKPRALGPRRRPGPRQPRAGAAAPGGGASPRPPLPGAKPTPALPPLCGLAQVPEAAPARTCGLGPTTEHIRTPKVVQVQTDGDADGREAQLPRPGAGQIRTASECGRRQRPSISRFAGGMGSRLRPRPGLGCRRI